MGINEQNKLKTLQTLHVARSRNLLTKATGLVEAACDMVLIKDDEYVLLGEVIAHRIYAHPYNMPSAPEDLLFFQPVAHAAVDVGNAMVECAKEIIAGADVSAASRHSLDKKLKLLVTQEQLYYHHIKSVLGDDLGKLENIVPANKFAAAMHVGEAANEIIEQMKMVRHRGTTSFAERNGFQRG